MFKENTVFVVGAGASSEFGLPLGSGLAQSIVENLAISSKGAGYGSHFIDRRCEDLLRFKFKDDPTGLDQAWDAAILIRRGILHAQSIDAFIDMHADKPAVATVGKLQIALEILRAERASHLAVDRSNISNRIDFQANPVSSSWLRVFTEILLEKARASDLSSVGRGVTTVCFNYDRCVEHYLIEAIEATLGVSYEEAHAVVYSMNIIHPYGSLGRLPSTRGGKDGVEFGADPDAGVDVLKIAEGLSTFTEEMKDREQLDRIHAAIGSSHRLVCLGFGFQSQNVQLLTPATDTVAARRTYGVTTGIGTHEVGVSEVRLRLKTILKNGIYDKYREAIMVGVGCGDLMRHLRLSLSGA